MDFNAILTNTINSVLAQFTVLSWTSILATVGYAEVYAYRQKQKVAVDEKGAPWFFAPFLGIVIGIFQTLNTVQFGKDGFFHILFSICAKGFDYGGLVPIAYLFALKPLKSIIEWVQGYTVKKNEPKA